ncbi:hypothetical protein IAI10_17415 [Clostridium sp. 19966]|uniref:hypothetical protein n=1 Tax=Clostridium sp. 19966 TaxID=2768166 RepID=UPI0028DE2208|nr:hypothetical protein [Clostridium sp. 19966]MDT8718447.1 hypothetical protein [Clostridium sp. 19966]
MKKKIANHLYFPAGAIFGIAAILDFVDHKITMGFTYICLAIVFCLLDFPKKKN